MTARFVSRGDADRGGTVVIAPTPIAVASTVRRVVVEVVDLVVERVNARRLRLGESLLSTLPAGPRGRTPWWGHSKKITGDE